MKGEDLKVEVAVKPEPILEFKNLKEAENCLKYYQNMLFLNDWTIKLILSDTMPIVNEKTCSGMHETVYSVKESVITIYKHCYKDSYVSKHTVEGALLHELLHLKYPIYEFDNSTPQDIEFAETTHALIEQMSKSILMIKYGLTFDWFKV